MPTRKCGEVYLVYKWNENMAQFDVIGIAEDEQTANNIKSNRGGTHSYFEKMIVENLDIPVED